MNEFSRFLPMYTVTYEKKINTPFGGKCGERTTASLTENLCVMSQSSASFEHSASVACMVEPLRHHCNASAATRQSAILHERRNLVAENVAETLK